ncbi:MAG: N-6 DNA methylase [Acidobacteriota bacterium]|nr:N-6 DNA methylase [Acidobacteriota bacterium]
MSLKKYLTAINSLGAVSETALYTPLATHLLSGVLHYPVKFYAINKSGAKGTPDVRILSGADSSEWIVCEAKLKDNDIRKEKERRDIWQEQILKRGYIRAETFYVLLCAPRTFYVCDLNGDILEGLHIEAGDSELLDVKSGERLPASDENFRRLLTRITFEASGEGPQYEKFRRGELAGGYILLSPDTVNDLQSTFDFAVRQLKTYCAQIFDRLKQEYRAAAGELQELNRRLEGAGSDVKSRRPVEAQIRRLRRKHELVLQLFDIDYPQFKHDQTYAGTEKEEHFEDIFITNTAYVALSRLFFVRICEDIGLTTRKISHEGPGIWRRFVEHIKGRYQDLFEIAYKDVAHVYSQLFEETVFDWYGRGNGELNDILERILFRLNAFSFQNVSRDVLGSIYQYFRPRTERKRLGEYYTPDEVVDYILAQTGIASDEGLMQKRVLDPSCGSFTFGVRALVPLLERGKHLSAANRIELVRRCLAGFDINPFSVFLSHLSVLFAVLDLYLEAKKIDDDFTLPGFNIHNRNALTFVSQMDVMHAEAGETQENIDYVVGNPPFVRNERLPPEDREVLRELFADVQIGNTDLSIYFLYSAMKYWLREGGVLGMVAPIGTANTKMSEPLRAILSQYAIFHIVSLEWMAKEIFPDADIIPMLIFARKQRPTHEHTLTVMSGLQHKAELRQALTDPEFFAAHASQLNYQQWRTLSPTGDWPLEVKAEDVPVLEKLKQRPKLETIVRASFAVKVGARAKIIHPNKGEPREETKVVFLAGQHVCAFSLTDSDEMIDLSKISQADDGSIWKDLNFYRENVGQIDETGLGRYDYEYEAKALLNQQPSDSLCCFVSEIYVTLVAAVGNPLEICANNSVMVVVPFKYSAHVIAAIINSRISRYYAFLLLRSSILKRRRSTWYPRTIKNLPLPDLTGEQAAHLHRLAKEAAALSQDVRLDELDAYLDLRDNHQLTKAGFLGINWSDDAAILDRDELAGSRVTGGELRVGSVVLTGDASTLALLRLALLALNREEIAVTDIQDVPLPEDAGARVRLASEIGNLAARLDEIKQRMNDLTEEMDEIIADGLGLTSTEHELIRRRCREFPLSVTVELPRYVWSADRKRQARRIYQPGARFK